VRKASRGGRSSGGGGGGGDVYHLFVVKHICLQVKLAARDLHVLEREGDKSCVSTF
jgi:hypothetical protein